MLIRNRRDSLHRFSYFCHVKYSELPISQPPDSQTSLVVHGPLTFILTLSIAPMFGLDWKILASRLSMSLIEPCMLLKVNSGTRLMASDVKREYSSSQVSLNRSVLLLQASYELQLRIVREWLGTSVDPVSGFFFSLPTLVFGKTCRQTSEFLWSEN